MKKQQKEKLIRLTPGNIVDLHNFLSRVDLKGKEAFVFTELVQKIEAGVDAPEPKPDIEVKVEEHKKEVDVEDAN